MHRRNLMDRLDNGWAGFCLWFLRRRLLPPDRSVRLIGRLSFVVGRRCPVAVRVRG